MQDIYGPVIDDCMERLMEYATIIYWGCFCHTEGKVRGTIEEWERVSSMGAALHCRVRGEGHHRRAEVGILYGQPLPQRGRGEGHNERAGVGIAILILMAPYSFQTIAEREEVAYKNTWSNGAKEYTTKDEIKKR